MTNPNNSLYDIIVRVQKKRNVSLKLPVENT